MPRWRSSTSATCLPIVTTGLSEDIGSWNTIAMSRPRMSRIWSFDSVRRSVPSNRIEPETSHPRLGQQSHDRERRDALAAAGLADDADRLARVDGERDAVDGADVAPPTPAEHDLEVLDLEQRAPGRGRAAVRHGAHRRYFGSRASRRRSPNSVKPSAANTIARPGKIARWIAPER